MIESIIIFICLLIAFSTLIYPEWFPFNISKRNKHIIGIISLLCAYYYYNDEKLF